MSSLLTSLKALEAVCRGLLSLHHLFPSGQTLRIFDHRMAMTVAGTAIDRIAPRARRNYNFLLVSLSHHRVSQFTPIFIPIWRGKL